MNIKLFMEYEAQLKSSRQKCYDEVEKKFYELLIKYDINLKEIDELIITEERPTVKNFSSDAHVTTTIKTVTNDNRNPKAIIKSQHDGFTRCDLGNFIRQEKDVLEKTFGFKISCDIEFEFITAVNMCIIDCTNIK